MIRYSRVATHSTGTTSVIYTLKDDGGIYRRFSEAKYVYIELYKTGNYGSFVDAKLIPMYFFEFTKNDRIYMKYNDTIHGGVSYKSDTTVNMYCVADYSISISLVY